MIITTKSIGLGLAMLALLSQIACSGQTVLTTGLALLPGAADLFLNAADPSAVAVATPYITDVVNLSDLAIAEYHSTDSPAEQWQKISAYALTLVKPQLPAGTPTNVVNDLEAIDAIVQAYLSGAKAITAAITATPAGVLAFNASGPKALKLTHADLKALPKISAANAKLRARLKH